MLNSRKLLERADWQYGYFSAFQAKNAGYVQQLHAYHVKEGNWLAVERGLYRMPGYPDTLESDYTRWSIWYSGPKHKRLSCISHESAAFYYGLILQKPGKIHLTHSSTDKVYKKSDECVFHSATISEIDCCKKQGFTVTSPYQTLADLKPDLILQKKWTETVTSARAKNLIDQEKYLTLLNGAESITDNNWQAQNRESDIMSHRMPYNQSGQNNLANQLYTARNKASRLVFGSRSAFTLVELLVVISIISILASMLLPVLKKASQQAKTIQCVNNLKQCGLAFSSYANDNNDYLPTYATPVSLVSKVWCSSSGPIADEYISTNLIYGGNTTIGFTGGCPSASEMWEYSMNWFAGCANLKLITVRSPSKSFIVCENQKKSYFVSPNANSFSEDMWRHNGTSNILYIDAHVKSEPFFNISTYSKPFWQSW